MIIISVIILIAFAIVYIYNYSNIYTNNIKELERIPTTFRNPHDNVIFNENIDLEELEKYFQDKKISFDIILNNDYEIDTTSFYNDYTDEEYIELLDNIVMENDYIDEVNFNDTIWLYKFTKVASLNETDDYGYKVSFVDITEDNLFLNTLLISLILMYVILLILIYFISLYFANKSIKPLERLWFKQKQFVADATHELKTPLTIISANTDLLLINEDKTIKSQKKWLEYIKLETNGMSKLINELLCSAKVEEENYDIKLNNISSVIKDLLLSFETVMFEKNIKLKSSIDKDIFLNTDVEKLRQVVVILLDNAIKYTEENGKIIIKVTKNKKDIMIKISNTGKGITNNDLPNIFDRFYKADKSRSNNNTNSYGLGLYIAKTIVTKLKGDIKCKSEENKMTTFIINFKS